MRRPLLLAALLALAPAAPALAQEPEPPPPPAPVAVQSLTVQPRATVLAGDRVRVRGAVTPATAGREVVVRVFHGGRKVLARRATTNAAGAFAVTFTATRRGALEARAGGRKAAMRVLPTRIGPRSGAVSIRALQARLDALGYVVGRRGRFDARTARAVLAFRKVTGMARTSAADEAMLRRLARGGGRFRVRFPRHGRHVEADISRQVVALIGADGEVERIYPTSTGAPATPTIRGSFRVYRKDPGTNALGMVHSAYFIRGYAIHGFRSVPIHPASHGCLRVPIPDALTIFRWVRLGTRVDTYA